MGCERGIEIGLYSLIGKIISSYEANRVLTSTHLTNSHTSITSILHSKHSATCTRISSGSSSCTSTRSASTYWASSISEQCSSRGFMNIYIQNLRILERGLLLSLTLPSITVTFFRNKRPSSGERRFKPPDSFFDDGGFCVFGVFGFTTSR